jgi:RHS repeat-associated protein
VFQVGTSTTTLYPFKWYSVASSTGTGAKYATTTEYVFNGLPAQAGDSLVSTTDHQTASGVASGTAQTRYIHPDHLDSTNVVTNASGTVVQTLDYYPYGGTRISSNVGGTDSARKFIDRFADQSNLDYLTARYYEGSRGQFLSQDPVFLEIGGPLRGEKLQTVIANPQTLNSYSYAENNPIIKKDPDGRCAGALLIVCLAIIGADVGVWTNYGGDVLGKLEQRTPHPYEFTMSYAEIGTSGTLGAFELAALPEKRAISGLYAFGSSLAEDRAAGNAPNYGKASVSAGTSIIAGSFFKNLVGNVPASLVTRAQIANQVFSNASVLVANNAAGTNNSIPFQTAQSAAKAAGIGNTGSGAFVGTYNFGPGVGTFNFGTGLWVGAAQSTPSTIK